MLNRISLILFAFMALSGCRAGKIIVPNTEACTVAGVVGAGAICAETITGITRDMTVDEFFDFLEPKEEHDDVPGRAGAVCQTADDWNDQKTALEMACRILGKSCTYELKQVIKNMGALAQKAKVLNESRITQGVRAELSGHRVLLGR